MSQLIHSRWFPTLSRPILSGLIAMGVVYGLRAFGVTSVLPWEVNNAVTPFVGLLVAAIVQKPSDYVDPAGPPTNGLPAPQSSIGNQMAQLVVKDLADAIDGNPQLVKGVALAALTGKLGQPPTRVPVTVPPEAPRPPLQAVPTPPLQAVPTPPSDPGAAS